jgi:hypothetical protein
MHIPKPATAPLPYQNPEPFQRIPPFRIERHSDIKAHRESLDVPCSEDCGELNANFKRPVSLNLQMLEFRSARWVADLASLSFLHCIRDNSRFGLSFVGPRRLVLYDAGSAERGDRFEVGSPRIAAGGH